jgi:hypothetical protein
MLGRVSKLAAVWALSSGIIAQGANFGVTPLYKLPFQNSCGFRFLAINHVYATYLFWPQKYNVSQKQLFICRRGGPPLVGII